MTRALLLLALLPSVAWGQDHVHPTETITGMTAAFYETWMRPDQPTISCCNRSDCATATEVKQVAGRWMAKRKGLRRVAINPAGEGGAEPGFAGRAVSHLLGGLDGVVLHRRQRRLIRSSPISGAPDRPFAPVRFRAS
jgi:hypothetical protein